LGADYPRTRSVRRLLKLVAGLSGAEAVRKLLRRFSVELGAPKDACKSSRYVARDYAEEEVERLRGVVEEVMGVVG